MLYALYAAELNPFQVTHCCGAPYLVFEIPNDQMDDGACGVGCLCFNWPNYLTPHWVADFDTLLNESTVYFWDGDHW